LLSLLSLASATMYLTMGEKVRQSVAALSCPSYLRDVLIAARFSVSLRFFRGAVSR